MLNFITWYITLTLLGLLTFPLTYRLFPKLADRGYSFARTLGLLVWAYAFWMLASLGVAQNDIGGILLGLAILAGLSLFAATKSMNENKSTGERIGEAFQWMGQNLKLILNVEILFLLAFAFIAIIRAANPEALGTEKPMELAFINAILRSPTFPPRDPWLSGYAISYYHFGFIITAMIAKITATAGSVAFNLMLALVFALSAIGAYGVLYNLLAERKGATRHAFLAPLFLLLVGNFEGFLEILHQNGIFWNANAQNFWTWLDIKELSQDPATLGKIPDRFWWWWRASRVIQDYDLLGNFRETIDEFPTFSYVLGDLHPHVLAMPFALLAVVVALYIFKGGWQGETRIWRSPNPPNPIVVFFVAFALGIAIYIKTWNILFAIAIFTSVYVLIYILRYSFYLKPLGIFSVALVLGGIAFLNTWDILIAAALIASAYTFARVHADGWRFERLEEFILFGLLTGISAILLYLPFYLGFSSQAGGILPNVINPTRGAHLWVMFGTLLIPILLWLLDLVRSKKHSPNWTLGIALALSLPLFLWLFSSFLTWIVTIVDPGLVNGYLQSQQVNSITEFLAAGANRRWENIGGAITLFLLMSGIFAFLFSKPLPPSQPSPEGGRRKFSLPWGELEGGFVLLIAILASLLVLAPEYVYLRDQFGTRMNTIFKFYYQAWILWSIAAAYASATLFSKSRGVMRGINITLLSFVIVAGLVYPFYAFNNKTNGLQPKTWTLDGAAYLANTPDEAAAIAWLQNAPDGFVLEAVPAAGGSYTGSARISTNTGLPAVLGWVGHESQWRGGYEEMGSRQADIETIYTATDWDTTQALLEKYHVGYVVVGQLERNTYAVRVEKFERYLKPVFSQGITTIYAVP